MNYNGKCAALGYFDGAHLGHAAVIKTALALKRYEIWAFTFKNRGELNITTEEARFKRLEKLGVKRIFSFDFNEIKNLSPEEFVSEILIKEMGVKAVCCGYDFHFGKGGKADAARLAEICETRGTETFIIPPFEIDGITVSSTRIRELIKKGDIEAANKFLGYEYCHELEVVGGNKLGRTIGFPTINQNMPPDCVIPRFGVYKSRVFIKGFLYDGITNIGVKPTAGANNKNVSVETHIIGYDGDLYGEIIKVDLLAFIRDEMKFDSFSHLKQQIKKDLITAERM